MTRNNPNQKKSTLSLVIAITIWACASHGAVLFVPNSSFEQPTVPPVNPFAQPDMDSWQKSPQPGWYNPADYGFTPWEYRMGEFYNFPLSPSTYIDNCDGVQAAFIFAFQDVGIFKAYNTIYGTNTVPSHAFNAKYNVGRAYDLTVGLIGGGGGMEHKEAAAMK